MQSSMCNITIHHRMMPFQCCILCIISFTGINAMDANLTKFTLEGSIIAQIFHGSFDNAQTSTTLNHMDCFVTTNSPAVSNTSHIFLKKQQCSGWQAAASDNSLLTTAYLRQQLTTATYDRSLRQVGVNRGVGDTVPICPTPLLTLRNLGGQIPYLPM